MATDVDICNMGLAHIGAERIVALTDNTTEGRWCQLHYAPVRDALLTEHVWSFTQRQLELTGAVAGTFPGSFLYAIPAGILHIYRVYEDYSTGKQANWRRFGDSLEADINGTLQALAIESKPEAEFPSWFVHILAQRLAVEMTIPITRSTKMFEQQNMLYQGKLAAALATDGSEGRSERTNVGHLAGARFGQWP